MPPQSYSKACTFQWRPVTVVRFAVCKCTAGWANPKCTHGGGVSVRPRLASYNCATTEAWADCWCSFQALLGAREGK